MLGFALLLLLGLSLFMAWVIALTAWALTHPQRRTYAWAVARNLPGDPHEFSPERSFTAWTVRGRRHELPVWEITGDDPDGPTIVVTHGWNESRVNALPIVNGLCAAASRVVVWDLPGHGDAPGACRLGSDEHEDLIALVEHIGSDVVLYGRSLGAGVCIRAATDGRIADRVVGVFAEAPYRVPPTPARNVMRLMGMPHTWNVRPAFLLLGLFLTGRPSWGWFDRAEQARELRVPLTVLHPEHDAICPVEDGRAIAEAAGGVFVQIDGAGHNGLWSDAGLAVQMREAVREGLVPLGTDSGVAIPSDAPVT